MGDQVVVELQEGSPVKLELMANGGARVTLPRSAVERALLLAGTSYPVLVRNAERRRVLGELAGEASLAWDPKPDGEFQSALAVAAVDRAERELAPLELDREAFLREANAYPLVVHEPSPVDLPAEADVQWTRDPGTFEP